MFVTVNELLQHSVIPLSYIYRSVLNSGSCWVEFGSSTMANGIEELMGNDGRREGMHGEIIEEAIDDFMR